MASSPSDHRPDHNQRGRRARACQGAAGKRRSVRPGAERRPTLTGPCARRPQHVWVGAKKRDSESNKETGMKEVESGVKHMLDFKSPRVVHPCQSVNARCSLLLDIKEGPPQAGLTLRPAGLLSRLKRPLSRGSSPSGYPAEPLVSYQINRQLSGWNLPPLMIRAFGAHCHEQTFVKAARNSHATIYAAAASPRGLTTYSLRTVSVASTSTSTTS